MPDISKIKTDMDAEHPVTGAFNVDDQLATDEWNEKNRSTDGGVSDMLSYLVKNRSRSNNETDTVQTAILGRLESVAEASIGGDPFGAGGGSTITMAHIHAAKMFMILLTSPQLDVIDLINSDVTAMMDDLGSGPGNAKVWKTSDVDVLKALSQNQQSYSVERGHGVMRVGFVTKARAS